MAEREANTEDTGAVPFPESTPAPAPAPAPVAPAPAASGALPTLLSAAALLLAVVAIVLAVIGWFRPSTAAPKYTDDDRAQAKAGLCETWTRVHRAVVLQTNLINPTPDNPVVDLAIGANARLALYDGGDYLLHRLEALPATADDLRAAATEAAATMQSLTLVYLDGAADETLRRQLNEQMDGLTKLCE